MRRDRYLLDYVCVLVKWRRLVGLCVLSVTLASVVLAFVMPQQWTATTLLLPPEEGNEALNLGMLLQANVPTNLQHLVGAAPAGQRLLTILTSRRVLGAVVDSLDLVAALGAPSRNHAIDMLNESVESKVDREGSLTINATAPSARLAADIANALGREVDAVNRMSKSKPARELRQFLEERMRVAGGELDSTGHALQRFQDRYGVIDLEAQTTASVALVQAVLQQLVPLEVQLGMSRRIQDPDNEERARLELEVEETRHQLQRLVGQAQTAAAEDAAVDLRALGPSLQDIPSLAQTYGRLRMDLEVKQATMGFLSTRLEEAKYREAMDTPTLLVLDPAEPPDVRSAPRRTLIVILAFGTSLVVSVALALILESWAQPSPQSRAKLDEIRHLLSRTV